MLDVRIRTFATADRAALALARRIAGAVRRAPGLVLGLPTGRTPIPLYRRPGSAARPRSARLLARLDVQPRRIRRASRRPIRGSYRAFMQRISSTHVNLSPRADPLLERRRRATSHAECRRYERAITRAGGIDLLVLGLGANGHIGFNEPGRVARRSDASDAPDRTRHAQRTRPCSAADRRRAARSAVDGDGHDPARARHRAARDRARRRRACVKAVLSGPMTPRAARVVPAAAPRTSRCGSTGRRQPTFSSSRRRGSTSSPIASRTKSCARRSRDSACG